MAAPRSLTTQQEKAIAKAYAGGAATSDLAAKYSVHASTIRNTVVREGGTLRARGGIKGRPRKAKAA